MRYLLRHITQLQLPTMILLSLIALCMWIPSFYTQPVGVTISALSLSLCNMIGIIILCYKRGISRMFNLFTGYIFILLSSALLPWHACWQGQLVGVGMILAYLMLNHIDRHSSASSSEETFVATLLTALVSYWLPSFLLMLVGILVVLMYRKSFDGRAFLSILVGLLVAAVYAALFIWLGWIDFVWGDFFAMSTLQNWIPIAMILVSILLNVFFYSAESLSRGIVFLVYVALCVAGFVVLLVI